MYAIVEKLNHLAVHSLFDNEERANKHLKEVIPGYVRMSFFTNKSLTAESFEVIKQKKGK